MLLFGCIFPSISSTPKCSKLCLRNEPKNWLEPNCNFSAFKYLYLVCSTQYFFIYPLLSPYSITFLQFLLTSNVNTIFIIFKANFLATRALFQSLSCSYILSYAFMYLCLISRSMFVSFVAFNCNLLTLSLLPWETRNEILPMCFFSIPNLVQIIELD